MHTQRSDTETFFQVKKLSRLCPAYPSSSTDVFILDQRGTDGILALGLFELHSNLQYKEKIMPYLVDVLKGLPTAKWLEAREPALLSNSALAGEFGFCFVTLMSALAAKDNSLDGDIIKLQLSLFNTLIDQCCAYQDLADNKKGNLWTFRTCKHVFSDQGKDYRVCGSMVARVLDDLKVLAFLE